MQNPLTISLGYIYRIIDNNNPDYTNIAIEKLKGLPVDGIELAFNTLGRLEKFNITEENLAFLKGLKHNTIHAPYKMLKPVIKNFQFIDNEKSKRLLKKIEIIYKLVNARNVVFHNYSVKDFKQVLKYDFNASIENMDSTIKFNTITEVKELLNKHDGLHFIYDLPHALDADPSVALGFLDEFKDRMIESHISIMDKRNHWFTHKSNADKLMKEFKKRVRSNVILTNETVVWNLDQVQFFKDELEYLRNL